MDTVDNEVRGRLYGVLEGTTSVEDFEAWFVGRTWDERTPLIAQVDHLLAERSLFDEDGFLRELRALAGTIKHLDSLLVMSSATAQTIRPQTIHVGGMETIRGRLQLAGT